MHIVLIASFDASLLNFRGELLRALLAAGHAVTALAPFVGNEVSGQLNAMGVKTLAFPLQRTGTNPLADVATLCALRRAIKILRPDLVLSYTVKPVIYGSLAAKAMGVRSINALITGIGNALAGGATSAVVKTLYRRALHHNQAVLFQNPDDRDLFVSLGLVDRAKAHVVDGSGVDTEHFAPTPLPPQPRFFLLGRLLAEKGIREYVAAAKRFKSSGRVARFALAGWPDKHPNAISARELSEWQTTGVIDFLGPLDDPRPAYTNCSIYVLPSYREGTPRTVLEAMSMGRPIITTDAPGCRETVNHGENGLLVPIHDVDSLARAMMQLADDPALRARMGEASRQIAISRYDVHRVNRQVFTALGLGE